MFQSKKKKNTIIVGCGRLGARLANTMSDNEENVIIIDRNKDSFRKLSPSYGGLTIVGDASDFDVLKEAGIEDVDTMLVVTNNDNTNIMVAQIAKEVFGIQQVIARLYDPERECVYQEFGIETICPSLLSAKEISNLLDDHQKGGE